MVGDPVWPDDPSKLYENNAGRSYEQYGNDWECQSMQMAEVIGRMAYKEPKNRSDLTYGMFGKDIAFTSFSSDGSPTTVVYQSDKKQVLATSDQFVRANVTKTPKSCGKSLADSNWIYCNCGVGCNCKCFCHALFPEKQT